MSGPNRRIELEMIQGGEVIISTNFDTRGGRHEMRAVAVEAGPLRAIQRARELFESPWDTEFMASDGTVRQIPEYLIRHRQLNPIDDDIPF